jgi:hypothetical protein
MPGRDVDVPRGANARHTAAVIRGMKAVLIYVKLNQTRDR